MAKFKAGDIVKYAKATGSERTILAVGEEKYFVRFPDGNENVQRIKDIDKMYVKINQTEGYRKLIRGEIK